MAEPTSCFPDAPIRPGAVQSWRPASRDVDPWLVLRLSGYRRREAVTGPVQDAAARMAARAAELVDPRAVLRAAAVQARGRDGARLAGPVAFSGGAIGRLLEDCPIAVGFALTLGGRLEAEVARLGETGELLEAFLLDTAGWAALETAVRRLRLDLAARARAGGWRITHRLAPGYGDWPLAEQRELLRLLDEAEGLVHLSPHGVLVPFKSVTGLFGLAPRAGETG